jgi:uncharacterized membrane protein
MGAAQAEQGSRLNFIDFTRGLIMALMAWDHVSGFWNVGHRGSEGLGGTFPLFPDFTQFMLRFITHFCAPTFMFLAGTALALSTIKRLSRGESQRDITVRIAKRGGVLILLALFLEGNVFGNGPLYWGVISCFGACFIILSVYRRLPTAAIFLSSLAAILLHQFIDLSWIPANPYGNYYLRLGYYLRLIIHEPNFNYQPFVGLYPIIPWIGVIGLGWCFGVLLSRYDLGKIRSLKLPISLTGLASLVLFVVVRWFNGYGNLYPRKGDSLQDWLSLSKYPPDLAFLLSTLGVMCLILSLGIVLEEKRWIERGVFGVLLTFGRVPLFFYFVHLFLYRLRPTWMAQPLFMMDTGGTLVFWLVGLYILWRLCLRYERLKRKHPDSLLQYL